MHMQVYQIVFLFGQTDTNFAKANKFLQDCLEQKNSNLWSFLIFIHAFIIQPITYENWKIKIMRLSDKGKNGRAIFFLLYIATLWYVHLKIQKYLP